MPTVAAVDASGVVTQVTTYSTDEQILQVQALDSAHRYFSVPELLDAQHYRYDPTTDTVQKTGD